MHWNPFYKTENGERQKLYSSKFIYLFPHILTYTMYITKEWAKILSALI